MIRKSTAIETSTVTICTFRPILLETRITPQIQYIDIVLFSMVAVCLIPLARYRRPWIQSCRKMDNATVVFRCRGGEYNRPINIQYENEEGIDQGGLWRDFIQAISEEFPPTPIQPKFLGPI